MANTSVVLPQWPTGRVPNKAAGVAEGHVPAGKELGGQTVALLGHPPLVKKCVQGGR